ncbi:MAG TPA: bacillithiol system redox-active protein YtxJ [Xanthomarina sp.]|nr:bacillithiol system redox-active protein YtxJ [Xanthomarina sp.]
MSENMHISMTFRQFVRYEICYDYSVNSKFKIMGLFKNIFGSSSEDKEEKVLPWIDLTNVNQLNDIENKSKNKAQVIFKHSTRCGISRMVLKQFVASYNLTESDLDLYYLDLLNHRDVSSETGYKFQVMHESPQLLIVKNGVVVAHASHGSINNLNLGSFV